jgi:hypothetical protein
MLVSGLRVPLRLHIPRGELVEQLQDQSQVC